MNVAKGDKVVVHNNFSGEEYVCGVATVKSVDRHGFVRVDYNHNTWRYDSEGWPTGRAHHKIRPLAEGETAESIQAIVEERWDREFKEKQAKAEAKKLEVQRRMNNIEQWLKPGETYEMQELPNKVGRIVVVHVHLPNQPLVLFLRYGDRAQPGWEGSYWDVSIQSNWRERPEYISGGSFSATARTDDPREVVVEYLYHWANQSIFEEA